MVCYIQKLFHQLEIKSTDIKVGQKDEEEISKSTNDIMKSINYNIKSIAGIIKSAEHKIKSAEKKCTTFRLGFGGWKLTENCTSW